MSDLLRDRLISRVEDLPVLPAATRRLLTLDPTSATYFDDALAVVESEPSLSVRVLNMANSAASSPNHEIASVRTALARLGGSTVNSLALAASISEQFGRDGHVHHLWQHALLVGGLMRHLHPYLTEASGTSADEAYTIGLLHDIGHFVIQFEDPERMDELHEAEWQSPDGLLETEARLLGVTHTELGHLAASRWELPERVADAVLTHHDPISDDTADTPADVMRRLAQFCDHVVFPYIRELDVDADPAYLDLIIEELMSELPPQLDVDAAELSQIAHAVTTETLATLAALGLT